MLIAHHAPLRSALLSIRIQSSFPTPSCTAASTILSQNHQRCISFRIDLPRIMTKRNITPTTATHRSPTNPITKASTIPFHPRHASSDSNPSSTPSSTPPVLEPHTTTQPSVPAESASTVPIIDTTPDPTTSSAATITPPSPSPPQPPSNPDTSPTTTTTTTPPPLMTWNAFFHHRKIRRRYNLAFSLALSSSAIFAGTQYIAAQPNLDIFNFIGAVEPIFVMIGATLAAGAVGWVVGPSVGGWVFLGRMQRGQRGEFRDKEREFFKHVQKYRPNAGYSSASNPLPDWYGEKIGSLREYRTWLKDQRAFNKRRETNLL